MLKSLIEFLYRGFFGSQPETESVNANQTFSMVKKDLVQVTIMLDRELAANIEGLAQDMQTNVHDILIRLIKIANIIRVEKLYGIPSVSGNYLGVANHEKNEFLRINLDCPVKGKEPKQEVPKQVTDKKWVN